MIDGSDCPSGKEQFTRDGARDRVRWWRRRGGDRSMSAYRCDHCECYHVGHTRRSLKKRAKGDRR